MKTIDEEIQQRSFASPHHRAVVNLIFTSNWLQGRHTDFLKPYDISVQQFNILRILRGQFPKPSSVHLLKERMLDKNPDTSRLVDRLVKRGLVDRKECPSDRRQMDITITPEGMALLNRIDENQADLRIISEALTPEEANQLSGLLDKLRDID